MKKVSQILHLYNKNKLFYFVIILQFIFLLLTINIIFLKNNNDSFEVNYATQMMRKNDIYVFNEKSSTLTDKQIIDNLEGKYKITNVKSAYGYYNNKPLTIIAYEDTDLAAFEMPMKAGKWLKKDKEFVSVNFGGKIKNKYKLTFIKNYRSKEKIDIVINLVGQVATKQYVALNGAEVPKTAFSNLIKTASKDENIVIINATLLHNLGIVFESSDGFILRGRNEDSIVKKDLKYLKGIAIAERGENLIKNTKYSNQGMKLMLNMLFVFVLFFSITIIICFSLMSYENNKSTMSVFALVGASNRQISNAYFLNLIGLSTIILIIVLPISFSVIEIFKFAIFRKTKFIMILIDSLLILSYFLLNYLFTIKVSKQHLATKFLSTNLE